MLTRLSLLASTRTDQVSASSYTTTRLRLTARGSGFSFQWPDPKTGEKQSRAGMQSYRIEDGKLVETWITMRPLGTSWTDVAQERWTSPKK